MSQSPVLRRRDRIGMRWVWSLGGLTVRELASRVSRESVDDDILGRGAELAFFFFLSLFPLMIFASSVTGLVLGSDPVLFVSVLRYLSSVMPGSAFAIVRDALHDMTAQAGVGNLSLGLGLTLWSGAAGMVSVIEGLNAAYSIREQRAWWKRRLVAIALTIAFFVIGLIAVGLLVLGGRFQYWMTRQIGISWFGTVWAGLHTLAGLIFMLVVFDLIYLFAPNLKNQRWQAILPGSIVALLLWFAGSLALKAYIVIFNPLDGTYGALGSVIALMLWLYLLGVSILLGGEVNSEIRNAAAAAGVPEAKRTTEAEG